MTVTNGTAKVTSFLPRHSRRPPLPIALSVWPRCGPLTIVLQGTFLFTSESVGEGHPDKIW